MTKKTATTRSYTSASKKEKLRYMKVLEQCDMNYSLAGRNLGISRQTLMTYHKKYWNEYTGIKAQVIDDSSAIAARKIEQQIEISIVEGRITNTLDLLFDELNDRLKDAKERKKIYTKDLVAAVNVLIPYVAEKKMLMGVKDKDGGNGSTMFVQNIINQIVNSKQNPNTITLTTEEPENEGNEDSI